MSFDYSAAKAAIKKAGHAVSEGNQVLSTDIKEIVNFGRRMFGLPEHVVRRGLANGALLPEGFPGTQAAPVAEATAPVAQEADPGIEAALPQETKEPEAPAQTEAPKSKKSKRAEDKDAAPAEAPAQDAPAQDAPAGEQAAQ
jgi:hypothetical protein